MRDYKASAVFQAYKDPVLPDEPSSRDEATWTNDLTAFSPSSAETLVAIVRTLCPHDRVPDRCYRGVVFKLDAQAQTDPTFADMLAVGVQQLDGLQPLRFGELSEGGRVAALRKFEGSAFFRAVQRGAVRHLYDDREVWELLGYEGASHHLGGYRTRGFADLDWLPDPPQSVCEG